MRRNIGLARNQEGGEGEGEREGKGKRGYWDQELSSLLALSYLAHAMLCSRLSVPPGSGNTHHHAPHPSAISLQKSSAVVQSSHRPACSVRTASQEPILSSDCTAIRHRHRADRQAVMAGWIWMSLDGPQREHAAMVDFERSEVVRHRCQSMERSDAS